MVVGQCYLIDLMGYYFRARVVLVGALQLEQLE